MASIFDAPLPGSTPPAPQGAAPVQQAASSSNIFDAPLPSGQPSDPANDVLSTAFDTAGQKIGGAFQKLQGYSAGRFLTGALTAGGKILQPFQAPQQLLFGGIKSIEDLATTHNPAQAYEDLKTGAKAALGYLTYGGYNGGQDASKTGNDVRNHMIMGYDMLKQAGAEPWLAKWGGLMTDLFLDVPAVGMIGKAAKLDKIGNVGSKFEHIFLNGTDLQKFAAHLVAAPFSTAPLPHLVSALPANDIGNLAGRTRMAQNIGNAIEQGRTIKKGNDGVTVGTSSIEKFVSPTGRFPGLAPVDLQSLKATGLPNGAGIPDAYKALEDRAQQVKAVVGVKLLAAGNAIKAAGKGLDQASLDEYTKVMGRLVDHKGPADQAFWRGELNKIANAQPDPQAFLAGTDKALRHSTSADVYAAENLHAVGLMTPAELAAYQQGDKGHLRRMFALWDNPYAFLERMRTANTPASLTIDDAKLTGFFNDALAHPRNASNPVRSTGTQMTQDFKTMMSKPGDPAAALLMTMKQHNFDPADMTKVLQGIGGEYARKAGVKYVPDSNDLYKSLSEYSRTTQPGFGGAGGIVGGSSKKPIGQRHELPDYMLEAMGEVDDHLKRVDRQAQVVGKIISRRMVTQGYHDLMAKDGVILPAVPHGITDASGWRSVSDEQAKAFGLPQLSGKMIPAIFHRRLVDTVTTPDPTVLSSIFDFTAAAWRRAKLASPAAMARNLASGYVAANQYGIAPHELLAGAVDYHKLVSGARRGDGVFDQTHKVNGISMSELIDHGEFMHSSMASQEVTAPMAKFVENIGNSAGSPFQRHAEAAAQWVQDVSAGEKGLAAKALLGTAALAGDFAGVGSGPITKFLSDKYGMLDAQTKGAIYMALRKKGMNGVDAAHHADEALFNYENVPYAVNALRKVGLAGLPFASYQFLAAGRFFKNAYERPYVQARNYRIANSLSADQSSADKANEYYASPGYIKDALWARVGTDAQHRPKFVNLASALPESPVWDLSNSDNVTNFEPPSIQLYRTILSGQGYQGRATFNGGKSYQDTKAVNPTEAARGLVKSIWQFGAAPTAPGQPFMDRMTKSILANALTQDQIASPAAQTLLKVMQEGPAALYHPDGLSVQRKGGSAPASILDNALRLAGVTLQTIEPDYSKAGSGKSNLQGDSADVTLLKAQKRNAMRDAPDAKSRKETEARYNVLLQQAAGNIKTQTGASRAAK